MALKKAPAAAKSAAKTPKAAAPAKAAAPQATVTLKHLAASLSELDARSLTPQVVGDTLGALLKYQDDIARMQGDALQKVLKEATSEI